MVHRMIVVLAAFVVLVLLGPACLKSHRDLSSAPTASDDTFTLVVEDPNGQMLGYDKDLQGTIAEFATTKKRDDGATVITDITNSAIRRRIRKSVNTILKKHQLPRMYIKSYLMDQHITCHVALHHPKYRDQAEGFAGPGMLECSDAIVIGTTALSERPIWLQRGLLMQIKPEFEGMIVLSTVPEQDPPTQKAAAAATPQIALTWEQAAPYLSGIPLVDSSGDPGITGLKICVGENNLTAAQLEQSSIVQAAVRALIQFTKESEKNSKLIVHQMKNGRFAVEKLDPKIQDHLLELMQKELTQPNAQISSATGTNSN